ncbi:hypothetical protein MKW92_051633 [Papaver armeniacum]|nr:hypothetical protein MKW92_051633 [Papaver armeniacum]
MDHMYYIGACCIALCVVILTHYLYRWSNPKCNGKLPPGSMGFPLIGETIQLFIPGNSLNMPRFVKKRIARYGTLFRTSLAGHPVVISTDPEFNYFILQQERKLVELWYMDSFTTILGGTVNAITTSSYIHKYIRNIILNYLGTEALKNQLLAKIEVMANQGLQSWSTQPSSIELKTSIATMVFELTSMELYGYDSSKSSKFLSKMFADFFSGLMTFPLYVPGTAFYRCMKNQKEAVKLMKDIFDERINSPEKRRGDFLDQLIDDMKTEEFLTAEFVVKIMFALQLASFVSISANLTRTIRLMTENPLVMKEVKEENEEIYRRKENVDASLTWNDYKSMTFTSQVLNETFRMANIAPGILRRVIKDIHINGYVIPKGWTLMVVATAIHMNPKKFDDPHTFNPWRWNNIVPISAKDFVPFGGGMRSCVGAEFTKALMSVFLHVLVTKFSLTKVEGNAPPGEGFHVKITAN